MANGAPKPINSPYGNRPNTLPNPVATEGAEQTQNRAIAQSAEAASQAGVNDPNAQQAPSANQNLGTSEAPIPGQAPPEQELEDFESFYNSLAMESDTGETAQDLMEQTPEQRSGAGDVEQKAGLLTQASNVMDEFIFQTRKGFTTPGKGGSEFELMQVAEESGLFERVWQDPNTDDVMVQRPGQNPEPLERSLINARTAFEMAAEGLGRVQGAVGGAALGSAAPGGTIPGAAAGSVGLGTMYALLAKNTADVFAEHVLQIDRDPTRDSFSAFIEENALTAGIAATFGKLGQTVSKFVDERAAKKAASKEFVENAMERVDETAREMEAVQSSGIKLDATRGKLQFDPQQSLGERGYIPEVDANAVRHSQDTEFRNFREKQGKILMDAYDSITSGVKKLFGGEKDALAADVTLTMDGIRQTEGRIIGELRNLADERLAKVPQVAARTKSMIQEFDSVIRNPETGKIPTGAEAVKAISTKFDLDMRQARRLHSAFERARGKLKSDRTGLAVGNQFGLPGNPSAAPQPNSMSVDEAISLHKEVSQMTSKSFDSGNRAQAMELMKLRNSLRDDVTDMMGQVISPEQQAQYGSSMKRYREIMDSTRKLNKSLMNEDLSKDAFLGKLLSGQTSYKDVKAIKTIMDETSPETWEGITSTYFNKLKYDNFDPVTKKMNWKAVNKQWGKLDPRIRNELTTTAGIKSGGIESLIKLGQKYENTNFRNVTAEEVDDIAKTVSRFTVGHQMAQQSALVNIVGGFFHHMGQKAKRATGMGTQTDFTLMEWLADGGTEDLLRRMHGLGSKDKEAFRQMVTNWAKKADRALNDKVADTQAVRTFMTDLTRVTSRGEGEELGTQTMDFGAKVFGRERGKQGRQQGQSRRQER